MKKIIFGTLVFLLNFYACDTLKKTPQPVRTKVDINTPRLAVLISIDQMQQEYFDRFGDQFEAGFRRLIDRGAVFKNAHYQHAITGTAPGHATLSTGCHPAKHGIMGNNYYTPGGDEYSMAYAVTDTSTSLVGIEETDKKIYGSSPFNLQVPALGDWLKTAQPDAKVYSVAFKDRSATLMGGKMADRAFWFNQPTTRMVSSSYYKSKFPDWPKYYIGKEIMKSSLEKGWNKLRPEEDYSASREDDFPYELGTQRTTFPHTLYSFMPPASSSSFDARKGMLLWNSPIGDAYTLEFAKAIIENEKLGMDEIPDMLFVGCSIADKIGHQYGPYSQEIQDYYLRLDQYLGNFFAYLDERIGEENYYVVLSADHGVLPIPEELIRRGTDAQRITAREYTEMIDTIEARLQREIGLANDFIKIANYQGFALDYSEAAGLGISEKELQRKVADAVVALPFVEDVYLPDELMLNSNSKKDISFFRNNYRPDRGLEMKIRFTEYTLVGGGPNGTSHGSVYEYDTNVPIIFMGPQVKSQPFNESAGIVDIAPTLARILNVSVTGLIDGRPLDYIFNKRVEEEETKSGER